VTSDLAAPAGSGLAVLAAVLLVVAGVAAGHLTSLPTTLEDIDSVNFALGVRDFDPGQHRPHPPGYPVYVALGKAATAVTRAAWPDGRPDRVEARALAALSLAAALALVWLVARVSATFAPGGEGRTGQPWLTRRSALAALLLATCPLTLYLAARPMSDVPGLAAACAALACYWPRVVAPAPAGDGSRRLARARWRRQGRMIVLGALLAGSRWVSAQTLWITAPLLVLVLADRAGRGLAGALLGSAIAFTVGALAWGVPLLVASGGLDAYLRRPLGSQAGEDFAGVEMLSQPHAAAGCVRPHAHVHLAVGSRGARKCRAARGGRRRHRAARARAPHGARRGRHHAPVPRAFHLALPGHRVLATRCR
jgi:hypothetical protein